MLVDVGAWLTEIAAGGRRNVLAQRQGRLVKSRKGLRRNPHYLLRRSSFAGAALGVVRRGAQKCCDDVMTLVVVPRSRPVRF